MAAAADLAFTLDGDGVILEVSLGESVEPHPGWNALVGKKWRETVSPESQGKIEKLIEEGRKGRSTRSREVNQLAEGVGDVPFRFATVRLDDKDEHVVALGRDLRAIARLQQGMVTTQQAMEREYGRLRQADTRYRVLFHVSTEGVLVADGTGRRILEANPAAAAMLGESAQSLQGKTLTEIFEPISRPAVDALVAGVAAGAPPADVRATLHGEKDREVTVSAALFRQSGSALVLLRFWSGQTASTTPTGARTSRMLTAMDAMPDGFVVTGEDRRILAANVSFCELVNQARENQVVGEPLDRWLGRPGVDLNIMLANRREHGTVRNFSSIVRGDFGQSQEVLVTAVSALDGKVPCLGFTLRTVSSRVVAAPASSVMLRSVDQLRELVGRVALKELVRESADLIEKLCIEAALDVSGNNRASAAQLLGLSRQGLYSKLRRHGLEEFDPR